MRTYFFWELFFRTVSVRTKGDKTSTDSEPIFCNENNNNTRTTCSTIYNTSSGRITRCSVRSCRSSQPSCRVTSCPKHLLTQRCCGHCSGYHRVAEIYFVTGQARTTSASEGSQGGKGSSKGSSKGDSVVTCTFTNDDTHANILRRAQDSTTSHDSS